ncbi:glycoside hydrolase family 76 [Deinococcus grandis]|uniref:Glycoside hydrolase family 76 n=1 Tax=Deinococcus grandis TaxID=57498 RepID=A0A100HGQ0_9DEIO|nr:glycoside hydrolase family 76 [Deinococcus grandis]
MAAPAAGCPTPQPPTPEGQGGLTLALGKSFYSCGAFVLGSNVSGFDAILRPPRWPARFAHDGRWWSAFGGRAT